MTKIKLYNTLSSAFELTISTFSMILSYVVLMAVFYIYSFITDSDSSNISVATVYKLYAVANADIEVKYLLIYLFVLGLLSSIKCTLCKFVGELKYLWIHKLYVIISAIICLFSISLLTIAYLEDMYLLVFLTIITVILEFISVLLNLDFIEQLKYTGRE